MNAFLFSLFHPTQEDLVTAAFDVIFLFSGFNNLRSLYRDKEVKGFDWRNMVLYFLWNMWSIFIIYPKASLYLANLINCLYALTQVVWLSMYCYYRHESEQLSS